VVRPRRGKRVVDMTNQEAGSFYVGRARLAEREGDIPRANRLFRTAILHDPQNGEARSGAERTDRLCEHQGNEDPYSSTGHVQRRRRYRKKRKPWWKRLFG